MRAIRVASAALLAATTLTLTATTVTTAVADDGGSDSNITSFGFRVTPSTIAAGGQVTLSVDGCEGEATVTSGVFDDTKISQGQQSATATVFEDAKPGAMYEVTFDCKGEKGTTDLTIATGRPTHHPTSHPTGPTHHGVKAGVGGSLGGLDLHEIALGGALIAGTLGTAYYRMRRRTGNGDS